MNLNGRSGKSRRPGGTLGTGQAPPDPLCLLQDAIRCNTVTSLHRDSELADILVKVLETAGIDYDLRRYPDGAANLTATLRGAHPGPKLVLSGHLDTVPIGQQAWNHPPHDAEIVGDRLYGRGAADMKGGLIALLYAFLDAGERRDSLNGEVVFAATYGEECGSHGATRMLEDGQLRSFDAMIVAEPTSNQPLDAHKGALWVEVVASGKTSHSSAPHEGINAIELIHSFRGALANISLPSDPTCHLSPSTMAITQISGGQGNNVVPDTCSMTIDFRTLPSQEHSAILETLRKLAAEIADDVPGSSFTVQPIADLPSVRTRRNAPVVEAIQSALDATGRARVTLGAANYFTDASVFQSVGGDIIILGPGRADQAHQTDEYIEISEFHAAIGIYAAAIQAYNGSGSLFPQKQEPTEKVEQ